MNMKARRRIQAGICEARDIPEQTPKMGAEAGRDRFVMVLCFRIQIYDKGLRKKNYIRKLFQIQNWIQPRNRRPRDLSESKLKSTKGFAAKKRLPNGSLFGVGCGGIRFL